MLAMEVAWHLSFGKEKEKLLPGWNSVFRGSKKGWPDLYCLSQRIRLVVYYQPNEDVELYDGWDSNVVQNRDFARTKLIDSMISLKIDENAKDFVKVEDDKQPYHEIAKQQKWIKRILPFCPKKDPPLTEKENSIIE